MKSRYVRLNMGQLQLKLGEWLTRPFYFNASFLSKK